MDEMFDVVTRERQPLGFAAKRGADLPKGQYHIVVMAVIINTDGKILLTRRSMQKDAAAGKWECLAGSVLAGETSRDAIVREIKEEIGVLMEHSQEKPIGTFIEDDAIFDVWKFNTSISLDELVFQEDEVDNALYASSNKIQKIINEGKATKSLAIILEMAQDGVFN